MGNEASLASGVSYNLNSETTNSTHTNNNNTLMKIALPSDGYKVLSVDPRVNQPHCHRLNIMTDYIVGVDPRKLNLQEHINKQKEKMESKDKENFEGRKQANNNSFIELDVFSILQYTVRKVQLPILTISAQSDGNGHDDKDEGDYDGDSLELQPTLGITFRHYSQINDCILRISKVFQNSPIQKAGIKRNEYIVGIVEGEFNSIKNFAHAIGVAIEESFKYITLAVCDADGHTRLVKIMITELQEWKKGYGMGLLGCELAEGWLNKWELKKHIEQNERHKSKKMTGAGKEKELHQEKEKIIEKKEETKEKEKESLRTNTSLSSSYEQHQYEEVDMFKQTITAVALAESPSETRTEKKEILANVNGKKLPYPPPPKRAIDSNPKSEQTVKNTLKEKTTNKINKNDNTQDTKEKEIIEEEKELALTLERNDEEFNSEQNKNNNSLPKEEKEYKETSQEKVEIPTKEEKIEETEEKEECEETLERYEKDKFSAEEIERKCNQLQFQQQLKEQMQQQQVSQEKIYNNTGENISNSKDKIEKSQWQEQTFPPSSSSNSNTNRQRKSSYSSALSSKSAISHASSPHSQLMQSNILEITFKGILKNEFIDDASTICRCADYSKHCQKCFIEKDSNYYFFNKKTNKIVVIEKKMLFPTKQN